jgi:hypothetical protein
MGVSPYLPDERIERFSEISLICGERALPGWGGSRQPLDRQLRYYSEAFRLASAMTDSRLSPFNNFSHFQDSSEFVVRSSERHNAARDDALRCRILRLMHETPLARSGVSVSCTGHWPPKICGRWLSPPYRLQASLPVPREGRSLAVARAVPAVFGLAGFPQQPSSSLALLYRAISGPFQS